MSAGWKEPSRETLMQAAARIRLLAEATAAPHHPYSDKRIPQVTTTEGWCKEIENYLGGDMGKHAASWHPTVALAVAEWLEVTARDVGTSSFAFHAAFRFARIYLGDPS